MIPATHGVSGEAFSRLARGAGGAEAVGELCVAQVSKHRLLIRLLVEEARRTGHRHADLVTRAYESLAEMESVAADEVSRCLSYPAVGAWAIRACRSVAGGGGEPGRLAAVALAAAVRSGTSCRLKVPLAGGELVLPSVGRLLLPGARPGVVEATLEPVDGAAELRLGDRLHRINLRRDAPGWQVLHHVPLAPGLRLTIDDLDPYRWPGDDVDTRLTDERRRRWTSHLRHAWQIMTTRHWTTAGEIAVAVTVLTPVTARGGAQRSASARDIFGTIALSDPPAVADMALTLAHELQHAKLNALMELVALARPDDGRRYYAPWRDDPRPLSGLLHGAYAHAGVAGFWRRHIDDPGLAPRAEVEFARWREAAYHVTGTLLDSDGLTEAGTRFVDVLRGTLARWRAEPVSPAAAGQARWKSEHHRAAWVAP